MLDTIYHLIARRAGADPDSIALLAPGREPLTYGGLLAHLRKAGKTLRASGVRRGDRVATVMPDGPEAALAFLAVTAVATVAPLNPRCGSQELEVYFRGIRPRAILVPPQASIAGGPADAAALAASLGIPVLRLTPLQEGATGLLEPAEPKDVAEPQDAAGPHDVAMVLHTSGTTSRPKLVPLTQANLVASANAIAEGYGLGPSDRCLNVMPLFHVHGLVGGLLASLAAGGSVICPPGFWAPGFFEWLDAFRPTWYTAVPTMHQALLTRAHAGGENSRLARQSPLRFIRSCSAALPAKVMADLEQTFAAPVVEAYGMTEASHQIATNPLPPLSRKPGSVGLATGTEIVILDETGRPVHPGASGEVAVRGPGLMAGYESNQEANDLAFAGVGPERWFRTGDQGYLDAEGYLYITGRFKEMINRAGEKVLPREIDEVLLEHPAVSQAVAFGVPDSRLGEDVAAAVVLREGAAVGEAELRDYVAARLTYHKVPRRIVILPEIPKGPTGKVQRVGLAVRLGLAGAGQAPPAAAAPIPGRAPSTLSPVERKIAAIWAEVLALSPELVHPDDDFLDLGGDSILAARIAARMSDEFGLEIGILAVLDAGTVGRLAELITGAARPGRANEEPQGGVAG